MSIINDALKKNGQNNHNIGKHSAGILAKFQQKKTNQNKPLVGKWLLFAFAGLICAVLIMFTFGSSQDLTDSVEVIMPRQADDAAGIFAFRGVQLSPELDIADFRLTGILYDQNQPMAIINDRIVEPGAQLGAARILEIQADFVRLALDGKEYQLKIK